MSDRHRNAATYPQPKKQVFFIACALTIMVGTPALNLFDASALTQEFGMFNASSLWRIFVFVLVVVLMILRMLLRRSWRIPPLAGFGLAWVFYIWMGVATLLATPTSRELALATYRLAEWGVTLLVLQYFITGTPQQALASFTRLMRLAPLIALFILILIWFYEPLLTYSLGPNTFRLGGVAYHPNSLALLLGLGALYWIVTGHGMLRYLAACVLIAACFLTYSRSGIGSTILAALVYMAARGLVHRKTSFGSVFTVLSTMLVIAIISVIYFDVIFNLALRGENVTYVENFAGRTDIWLGALDLIQQSPVWGHGFIIGPKLLKESVFIPTHFSAAHSHNDIFNAAIAGGLISASVLLTLYARAFLTSLRLMNVEPLFIATFIAIFMACMFETGPSAAVGYRGISLLALLRTSAYYKNYMSTI